MDPVCNAFLVGEVSAAAGVAIFWGLDTVGDESRLEIMQGRVEDLDEQTK